jgi:ubiquinone biosynthesis protein
MKNQKIKLKRTATLVRILSKYGFEELLVRSNIKANATPDDMPGPGDKVTAGSVYERIRMALEELGPTYVKFGQAFSDREDLLPAGMITELQKLQDKVEADELNVQEIVADELGINPEDYFKSIDPQPLASASISQVYKAVLPDGRPVILKIKRPGIKEVIEADLLIMKDITRLLVHYNERFRRANLVEVLEAFEKSIHRELSFLGEIANIEQFKENFKGHKDLHPLLPYPELSNDNVLCMAYLEGVKITDKDALTAQGFNPSEVAQKGLNLYLVQVFEHGFFHADPHPGNLFVMPSGKIAFIDFGSMGRMTAIDKERLEHFIIYFIARDVGRLIAAMKKMAVRINIPDEQKLERDILEIFELLNGTALQHIDTKDMLNRFSGTLNDNDILMPEHLYLLVRGIVLLEGIGRKLDPDMNIVESVRPYVEKIMRQRFSPERLLSKGLDTLKDLGLGMVELPENLKHIINKINDGELKVIQEVKGLPELEDKLSSGANKLSYALIFTGLLVASALLIAADKETKIGSTAVLGLRGLWLSALPALLFIFAVSRKK